MAIEADLHGHKKTGEDELSGFFVQSTDQNQLILLVG